MFRKLFWISIWDPLWNFVIACISKICFSQAKLQVGRPKFHQNYILIENLISHKLNLCRKFKLEKLFDNYSKYILLQVAKKDEDEDEENEPPTVTTTTTTHDDSDSAESGKSGFEIIEKSKDDWKHGRKICLVCLIYLFNIWNIFKKWKWSVIHWPYILALGSFLPDTSNKYGESFWIRGKF